jgi:hypothetical protein
MAYLVLRGSDQLKYGTVTQGLTSQFCLGQDQYPKTIQATIDVLTNHRWDQKHYDAQKRNRDHRFTKEQSDPTSEDGKATSFAQGKEPVCYCCGKKGHYSSECEEKDTIPRDKWHVAKPRLATSPRSY